MIKEKVISPSQERINQLIKFKEDKEKGIYSGIPLWESFPNLAKHIPTIDKGQVIINFANSGVGKSMLTRFKDIIVPWLFKKNHPEIDLDLKFVIFLLEDDINRFKDYLISGMLYFKHGLLASPKELQSKFENPLSDEIASLLPDVAEEVDDLLSICFIEDSIANTYGIYKTCRLYSEEWGVHYYTPLISKEEVFITKAQFNSLKELPDSLKDLAIGELQTKGIDILEYKNFWKYSHYKANNPNLHVIGVLDNLNCLEPDRHEKSLMEAMENLMYNYARKNICKHWQWTWVAVQQSMGTAEETQYSFDGKNIISKLVPNLSHLGDSKKTQRAAHLIYSLFDPWRYKIESFLDYDTSKLKDSCRFMFVLKNNDGVSNIVVPLLFIGAGGWFKELPHPKEMGKIYFKLINKQVL